MKRLTGKVRANLDKEKAEDDAKGYRSQYNELTEKINDLRSKKNSPLDSVESASKSPVADGELIYKGQKWDNMSDLNG